MVNVPSDMDLAGDFRIAHCDFLTTSERHQKASSGPQ